ncbi:SPOR domain-containing protein [uncultured Sulfitobacter sp.]|uniref:SPOR domain-containing protein n=1 Tax=uncultured Sulfitobacter sp. TaxID=191468 RepID=UPI00261CA330|nr:SPOR domain-containing protein [uncultured Sulfitobacter sp.]
MADFTHSPQGTGAAYQHPEYSTTNGNAVTKLTNLAGAVVSLALVVGVGVWGYKLLVRDVTGIPVVRAAAGEMRVRPENPGGQLAQHQGLSVNEVAVVGASEALAEQVRLAPQPTDLAEEDQPMPQIEDAAVTAIPEIADPEPIVQDIAAAMEAGSIDSIVAQLTDGIAPLEQVDGEAVPVLASINTGNAVALLSGDGMRVSLRPTLRPSRPAATQAAAAVPSSAVSDLDISAGSLPAGTRLVQLGAFDTPEIARAQWGKLNARFAPFMEGKKRIVMEAKSGGRTFYRLRAQGFDDIGDARRFCSALVAESVDCIPVVTR